MGEITGGGGSYVIRPEGPRNFLLRTEQLTILSILSINLTNYIHQHNLFRFLPTSHPAPFSPASRLIKWRLWSWYISVDVVWRTLLDDIAIGLIQEIFVVWNGDSWLELGRLDYKANVGVRLTVSQLGFKSQPIALSKSVAPFSSASSHRPILSLHLTGSCLPRLYAPNASRFEYSEIGWCNSCWREISSYYRGRWKLTRLG